jgi:hypothetical protein
MSRALRVLIAWVMIFAIPLQGLAASRMPGCGTGHDAPVSWEVPAAAPHAGHGLHEPVPAVAGGASDSAGAVPCHGDAAPDDAGGAAAPDTAMADTPSPSHGKAGCSACAACCLMLALPARFSLPEATALPLPRVVAPPAPVGSLPPDGLDRPPRPARA